MSHVPNAVAAAAVPMTPPEFSRSGVILVGAGSGTRLGAGIPKAFTRLGGRTLLEHGIATVLGLPGAGQLVLVVPADRVDETWAMATRIGSEEPLAGREDPWRVTVIAGGAERHLSVQAGLRALGDSVTTVLIHDVARPLTPPEVFLRVLEQLAGFTGGIIPALPVVDTIKRIGPQGAVEETIDRTTLRAVQTPQGFSRSALVEAHRVATGTPTDDAEVLQAAGYPVRVCAGDPRAHKLTTPWDAEILEQLLRGNPRNSQEEK